MPVHFLTADQQRSYGRYADEPPRAQLGQYFHLDDRDRGYIYQLREDHTRPGFAVQLATARFLGTFLRDPRDVPSAAVRFLADQLGIDDPSCLDRYLDRTATHCEHTAEIRRRYGYRASRTKVTRPACARSTIWMPRPWGCAMPAASRSIRASSTSNYARRSSPQSVANTTWRWRSRRSAT